MKPFVVALTLLFTVSGYGYAQSVKEVRIPTQIGHLLTRVSGAG
jgi:hypothetical protein